MMSRQLSMPARRLLWTFVGAFVFALAAGGTLLWVASAATDEQTYRFCVNEAGKVRLLDAPHVEQDAPPPPRPDSDSCRRSEHLIEIPTDRRVTELEAAAESMGSSLAEVLASLVIVQGDVAGAQDAVEGMQATIDELLAAMASATADIGALQTDVASAQTGIGGLQGSIADLEERVAALEAAVATPTPTPTGSVMSQVLAILGETGVVAPLVDPAQQLTFTTAGAIQQVFTWTKLLNEFDTPVSTQGTIEVVTFNGIDEGATSQPNGYWVTGDGSTDTPFSIGVWVNLTRTGRENLLVRDSGSGRGSWRFGTNRLLLRDQSARSQVRRDRNTVPSLETWHFLVVTYSGAGGPGAANGITMYEDGVVAASTATNAGGYLAMEPAPHRLTVAQSLPSVQFLEGKMAGGGLGPFFVHAELTPAQIAQLDALGRAALGI